MRSQTLRLFLVPPALALALAACASDGQQAPPAAGPPAAAAPAPAGDDATAAKIKTALAGAHRAEKNRARDVYRHPVETLTFFGVRDDMTVIELWPGGGWYTEVLGPVLKEKGKLIVTSFDVNGPPDAYNTKRAKEMQALLEKNKEAFGDVGVAVLDPPNRYDLGAPGSVDMVLTFRNLHGWMSGKYAEMVIAAAFRVLKPGGVLGVVDHRGKPGQDPKSGYVDEAEAIKLIEGQGFKLAAKSEVNANPKDTKDYPDGVWTLPPSLRLKDKDKDRYLAIGESDRFTLKFVKP